jgi:hypothetical protein
MRVFITTLTASLLLFAVPASAHMVGEPAHDLLDVGVMLVFTMLSGAGLLRVSIRSKDGR